MLTAKIIIIILIKIFYLYNINCQKTFHELIRCQLFIILIYKINNKWSQKHYQLQKIKVLPFKEAE